MDAEQSVRSAAPFRPGGRGHLGYFQLILERDYFGFTPRPRDGRPGQPRGQSLSRQSEEITLKIRRSPRDLDGNRLD